MTQGSAIAAVAVAVIGAATHSQVLMWPGMALITCTVGFALLGSELLKRALGLRGDQHDNYQGQQAETE
jgi:ABC-type dipeptide/oligopeptide/nickel transport system permease subunit